MTTPFRKTSRSSLLCCLIATLIVFTLASSVAAFAQVNGAIYTTNSDGSTVNGNIYLSKDLVYLSGGPENKNASGLSPAPGYYYFQVTDPSGVTLLSTDDITCRVVYVNIDGRVDGIPGTDGSDPQAGGSSNSIGNPTCYHTNGTANDANGALPVQLIPYNETPNNGGEYKAWMTPVGDYDVANAGNCNTAGECWGFFNSNTKTDNFKVRKPGAAYVTVCKFNDQNDNGVQDNGEPPIPHWPVTATGVDGDTGSGVTEFTDDLTGCVSFAVSSFPNGAQSVTLTEGTQGPDWSQTAPPNGACGTNCNVSGGTTYPGVNGDTDTTGGVINVTLSAGDNVTAPNFGNFNPFCTTDSCQGGLEVVKDAFTSYKYTWGIAKSVDHTSIQTSQTSTTVNYTVTVTNNGPAGWQATGTIKVANTSSSDITGVNVTDTVDNGGSCVINDGTNGQGETVPAGSHISLSYTCTYTSAPNPTVGTNTATAISTSGSATGTHSVDFTSATVADTSVTVKDSLLNETLGTVSIDPSTQALTTTPTGVGVTSSGPGVFNYSYTINGTPGTCVTVGNTATFTTNTSGTTGKSSQSVQDCVGADLTVSKTATPSFTRTYNWKITKSVSPSGTVEQSGSTATLNYTVTASEIGVTDSGWVVSGKITVSNPNNWEPITATVSDSLDTGANCTYSQGTSVTVAASGSSSVTYSCKLTSGASGTNYATATWSAATYFTPDGTATSAGVPFAFTTPNSTVDKTVTVTDTYKGTLGTLTATDTTPYTTKTWTYSRTVTITGGSCSAFSNTATVLTTVLPQPSASANVTICNKNTGGLTMGFWQNKNGQAIITGQAKTGTCPSATWLRGYAPFLDLPAADTCAQVGTYVTNIIKAANASGAAMNAMLKAQMLATALDVYFSDPALGGNKIGAAQPIGGDKIDLTQVCVMIDGSGGTASCSGKTENCASAFGGVTCQTVSALLSWAASLSNSGGSSWYLQNKTTQGLAKNTFDAINNQAAYICP